MKDVLKKKKRILSLLLAGMIVCSTSTSIFASDTLPYLGESAKGENQPYEHGYRSLDLKNWSPETDPYADFMRAQVPLQERNEAFTATQANPNLNPETQYFNLSGDYGNAFFDSYSYTNEFSQYLFNYWQYIDYHGSWHGMPTQDVPEELYQDERGVTDAWQYRKFEFGVINMPNPGYTNAAHKNGVLSLGCIFTPRTGQKHSPMLEQDENGNFIIADKLAQMCKWYGFDGWFINQEEKIPAEDVPLYKQFMKQMRDQGIYIQWYDSITQDGYISYQNEFNSVNSPYVQEGDTRYSDSIFLNYWWSNYKLKSSAEHAKEIGVNPLDTVFAGVESGMYRWQQPYDLRDNLGEDGQPMNSIASLGAEFVHDGLDEDLDNGANNNIEMRREKDEYQWMTFDRERVWWTGPFEDPSESSSSADRSTYPQQQDIGIGTTKQLNFDGVSAYIAERSVINGDTFVTNFNTGHGLEYVKAGEISNDHEWSNINIQDILPTWQWWIDSESDTELKADFDYGSKYTKMEADKSVSNFDFDLVGAYEGGSSLAVYGKVDAKNTLHLYKTDLAVEQNSKMDITFKKTTEDDVTMKLGLIFKDDAENMVTLDVENSQTKGEWTTSTVDLSQYAGKQIAAINLVFEGTSEDYQINIGQMKYTSNESQKPQAPTGLTIDKAFDTQEMYISWDIADYDTVKQYNVYAEIDGKDVYLGGIYDDHYYIKDLYDATGDVEIKLTAVSEDGTESDPATVNYNYDNAFKDVEVIADDGRLDVFFSAPENAGEITVEVTPEYTGVEDQESYTTTVEAGENSATVKVPQGADADNVRYTMKISAENGSFTTFDGKLKDSYAKPYTGTISAGALIAEPEPSDWWKLHCTYTTAANSEPTEKSITRGADGMFAIPSDVKTLSIVLEDYSTNKSAPTTYVFNESGMVNTSELNNKINEAKALDEKEYTPNSWAVLKQALANAETVLNTENVTQEQVDTQVSELQKALDQLAEKVNKENLQFFLDKAKQLKADGALDGVVSDIVKAYNKAISDGDKVLKDENATLEQVDNATKALILAIQSVDIKVGDKESLQALYNYALEIQAKLDNYVDKGKDAFNTAMNTAKTVLDDENALQEDIDKSWEELTQAIADLRLKANKDVLQQVIDEFKNLDTSKYTAESVKVFKEALAKAEEVLNNNDLSEDDQDVVDKAVKDLKAAKDGLVPLSSGNGDGDGNNTNNGGNNNNGNNNNNSNNNNNNNSNNNQNSQNNNNQNKGDNPKTSDNSLALLAAVTMLASGISAVAFKKRAKR